MSSRSKELINEISNDQTHGAEYLSIRSLRNIKRIALEVPQEDAEELLCLLKQSAAEIAESKSGMSPLNNRLAKLFYDLPRTDSLEDLHKIIPERVEKLIEEAHEKKNAVIQEASKFLGKKNSFITISYSSTVKETIQSLHKPRIIISESRPLLEGKKLARELADDNIDTTLIIDAAIGSFIEEVEVAITGADSILSDGSVVNKVGTKLLALAAKDMGRPFYAICGSIKFDIREKITGRICLKEGSTSDIANIQNVNIRNPVFEITPPHLITGIITDIGVLQPSEVSEYFKDMRGYVESFLRETGVI